MRRPSKMMWRMNAYVVTDGGFWENIENRLFFFPDGESLYKNGELMTYCEFLLDIRIEMILSMTLCDESETFLPLKYLCATSCDCDRVLTTDCPTACVQNEE